MFLPPASRTTMSGRARPPSAPSTVTCSSKSHRALIPASSTTRRSCISPHRPRASGRRRAVTRAWVCSRSWSESARAIFTCSASAACDGRRAAVRLAQLVLYPGQGLAQRLDQVRDCGLALVQLARGGDVGRGQTALGDLQEPAGALVQGLRGQLPEPLGELPVEASAQAAPARPVPRCLARSRRGLPGQAGRVSGQPAAGQQVAETRRRARGPVASPASSAVASMSPCLQPADILIRHAWPRAPVRGRRRMRFEPAARNAGGGAWRPRPGPRLAG